MTQSNDVIAITVSTNYVDILKHTMQENIKYFTKWIFITDKDDVDTIDMLSNNDKIEILFFDFKRDECDFNKGGAIQFAQEYVYEKYPDSWYLIIDSDIALDETFRYFKNTLHVCDENAIYGNNNRKIFDTLDDYKNNKNYCTYYYDISREDAIGYFQLYKRKIYYNNSKHAGDCDIDFSKKFKKKYIISEIQCSHLGTPAINWKGRIESIFPVESYIIENKINTSYHMEKDKPSNKNLIYYTIGNDEVYVEFLERSIKTLRTLGNYSDDILIISDDTCIKIVKEKFIDCKILHIKEDPAGEEQYISYKSLAAFNKLRIAEYENILKYENIIYLDLDMLIQNDINAIFDIIPENKILISNEEGVVGDSRRFWGSHLFSAEEKIKYNIDNINGINSGFFGFKPLMLHHFSVIYNMAINDADRTHQVCEQPVFNRYLIINNLYDSSATNLFLQKGSFVDPREYEEKTVIHFANGVGNYNGKKTPLYKHFNVLMKKFNQKEMQ